MISLLPVSSSRVVEILSQMITPKGQRQEFCPILVLKSFRLFYFNSPKSLGQLFPAVFPCIT